MATVDILLRLTEYLLTDRAFSLKDFWIRRVDKLTVIATKFWRVSSTHTLLISSIFFGVKELAL